MHRWNGVGARHRGNAVLDNTFWPGAVGVKFPPEKALGAIEVVELSGCSDVFHEKM